MKGETRLGSGYWKLWSASVVSNLGDGLSVVAYPWLASALTRDPIAIAGVAIATRIPWLLFTLPAGVITDRADRRKLVGRRDLARFGLALLVALTVLAKADDLADPEALANGSAGSPPGAQWMLIGLYAASLLLGAAEVLRDNSAQTLLPSLVDKQHLERANGRMWGAETVMNSFIGPPVAGLLLAASFALPFAVDAATFGVAGGLVLLISGDFRPRSDGPPTKVDWRAEIGEGMRWLWSHDLLRSLAVSLGVLNGAYFVATSVLVLFAQEVLDLGPAGFAALTIAGAVGGVVGSLTAHRFTSRVGTGPVLHMTILGSLFSLALIGLVPWVPLVFVLMALSAFLAVQWNVITVALRQAIIPDHLLGRVNSVYRFFGWGMMPVGSLLGGLVVAGTDLVASRETALRMAFVVAGGLHAFLFVYAAPRLTTSAIERARAAPDHSTRSPAS